MKILVIESSPHKQGSSNMLADKFMQGAKLAGHEVSVFDAAHANLHPCLGCNLCGMAGPCVLKDDMEALKNRIREADMLVFVTPLYYYGMTTQLKMVIDRFYSFNNELTEMHKKAALIVVSWENLDCMSWLQSHYLQLCNYLNFDNKGMILGAGCGTVNKTKTSKYLDEAFEFGKKLK